MGKLTGQQLDLMKRFVLRARIVQDHSLASDIQVLRNLSKTEFDFDITVDTATGETSVHLKPVTLLPTEQLESAAARVRPIFLKKDKVHYESVLDAINTVLKDRRGAAGYVDRAKELRARFRQADPDYPAGRPEAHWSGGALSNKHLSSAWLYGHLLHEDALRRSYRGELPLEEMYVAAMRTVCSELLATVETLHLIEELQMESWLELPANLFTEEVTIKATSWLRPGEVTLYTAPVGTALPQRLDSKELEEEGWSQAAKDLLPPTQPDS